MKDKWHQKRLLLPDVLRVVGVQLSLWETLGTKVHDDDIKHIAMVLSMTPDTVTRILYEPCKQPFTTELLN